MPRKSTANVLLKKANSRRANSKTDSKNNSYDCVNRYLSHSFSGRPSHAAAAPWLGINALDAAVAFYTSISMLRQQTKPTSRVHAIITDGGEKPNIIPERSELSMYVRGLTDEDTLDLTEKVKNCARGAATATGNI